MNRRFESHLFWGSQSPLSSFGSVGLIILASSRFAFAVICTGALIWVFALTALVYSGARAILPARGKMVVLLFLSAFFCGIFMLLAGLLNPLLVLGTAFFMILVPPCCLGTEFFENSEPVFLMEVFSRALLEAIVLAGIILALALIREPLGMGTLSFPGGAQGIIELFGSGKDDAFVLARSLSVSAGGLLLLGYGTALFRYFGESSGGISRNGQAHEGIR